MTFNPIRFLAAAGCALAAVSAPAQVFVRLNPAFTLPTGSGTITGVHGQPDADGFVWTHTQSGRLHRVNLATRAVGPTMISLQVTTGAEQGLLGLAFHPEFATNRRVYLFYTDSRLRQNCVSEFVYDPATPDVLPIATERRIINLGNPGIHNGGWIGFGQDGYLYIARGEAGDASQAQTTSNLYGKMLRLDIDADAFPVDPNRNYAIPATNPFAATAGEDEIWDYGLRNPWRCSFDRETGDLWIGDVGGSASGEISMHPASTPGGLNFGWPCMEGDVRRQNSGACADVSRMTPPVYDFGRPSGTAAITGGYVYRGQAMPRLRGTYLFGDYAENWIWALGDDEYRRTNVNTPLNNVTSFGEDSRGEVYVGGLSSTVYRLECGADYNADGIIDFFDVIEFYDCFEGRCGQGQNRNADTNGDGFLDFFDVSTFFDAFEQGC